MDTKICKSCGMTGALEFFKQEIRNNAIYYRPYCNPCFREKKYNTNKIYRKNKSDKIKKTFVRRRL